MEDQGKRLLLAVAIAFGLMMVWGLLFPPDEPKDKPKDETVPAETASGDASDAAKPGAAADRAQEPEAPAEPAAPRGDEQFFDFEFETFSVQFSSYGGAVSSVVLAGENLVDRRTGEQQDLVLVPGGLHRLLRVSFPDSTFPIPDTAEWKGERRSDTEIAFSWSSEDLRVVKLFVMHPKTYSIELLVDVEVLRDKGKQSLAVSTSAFQDVDAEGGGSMARVDRRWAAACRVGGEVETRSAKKLAKSGNKNWAGEVDWAGFIHAYFLIAVAPKESDDRRISCVASPIDEPVGGMDMALIFPTVELEPGAPITERMVAYVGPKYLEVLEDVDSEIGYGGSLVEAVDLGMLSFIAGPLLWLLSWFHGLVGSWAISIILLTLVVKGLTLPWTHKSMKSMQAMAKLRPQMDKIREKYKDDKQRQQVETMNLFKTHGVNPLSGCLPMLLQMPIWFALYRALTVAAELYQTEFLWLPDLTLPDPYYIMPIALTAMMFLQTRLTPSTATGAQQKMLTYGMPIMFGVFSFFFPAGLTLYIFTNTVLTAAHHLYLHRDRTAVVTAGAGAVAAKAVVDVESEDDDQDDEDSEPSGKSAASAPSKRKGGKRRKRKGRR